MALIPSSTAGPTCPTIASPTSSASTRPETFGSRTVPYIAPERVQESEWVRVLVAKDAISTGWDCPRAEVMVSFRAATDQTHITQLLGRMVRTPLARRIPGNERLNAVDCLLPALRQEVGRGGRHGPYDRRRRREALPGRRVLINPREMKPNPAIPEDVWESPAVAALPDPAQAAGPPGQAADRAGARAGGGRPAAGRRQEGSCGDAQGARRAQVRYADEIAKAREGVLTVEGMTVVTDVRTNGKSFNDFVEAADYAVIEDAYKRAARVLSPDLATTYSEHLAAKAPGDEDPDDALIEAHT